MLKTKVDLQTLDAIAKEVNEAADATQRRVSKLEADLRRHQSDVATAMNQTRKGNYFHLPGKPTKDGDV